MPEEEGEKEDKRGNGREDREGEAMNKKAMPQIQVSNSLISLPEGAGGLEIRGEGEKQEIQEQHG